MFVPLKGKEEEEEEETYGGSRNSLRLLCRNATAAYT